MSSPIALRTKDTLRKILMWMHQRLSHTHRIEVLSQRIASLIRTHFPNAQRIQCLDVGCGDMQIAENISSYEPKTNWNCIDIHDLPESLLKSERWAKYQKFDGAHIPFADKSKDVVLFCDVLHHAVDTILPLLREAARVGKIIIVKDHFEYSTYSRIMLRFMDLFGNWSYGIKTSGVYFTEQSFKKACSSAGLGIVRVDIGIDLYRNSFLLRHLLQPTWQFIAVLKPTGR